MSTTVMIAVLFSALLHASWNAVVKSGREKGLDIVLVATGSAAIAAAVLPFLTPPAQASWHFLGVSALIHLVYFVLVGAAYRAGDMGHVYPLMRGTPPLLVALASGPLIGETLKPAGWFGILFICGGILAMAFVGRRGGTPALRPTLLALANALVIAGYTFVDGLGARASGSPAAYTLWGFLLMALPMMVYGGVVYSRTPDIALRVRSRLPIAFGGGACSIGAYVITLWAMTEAPIALVSALRETSIIFAVAISTFVLKERSGWSRTAAAGVIMAGIAVLKLS